VAAQLAQDLGLSLGLDALGDRDDVEGLGELDDRGDDRAAVTGVRQTVDERLRS
jgi:hypothetical protein